MCSCSRSLFIVHRNRFCCQCFIKRHFHKHRTNAGHYICNGGSSLHFQRAAALHQSHAHRYRAKAYDPSTCVCLRLVEGNFPFISIHSSLRHIVDHCNLQGEDISSSIYKDFLVAPLHLTDAHRQQFPPTKFLPALARLNQAHEELDESMDWLQPKGVGVVCIKDGGIKAGSFVHFYFGKM